jgi:hypothetical protein
MGMTWEAKAKKVGFVVFMVSALALASGANFVDQLWAWLF